MFLTPLRQGQETPSETGRTQGGEESVSLYEPSRYSPSLVERSGVERVMIILVKTIIIIITSTVGSRQL